MDISDDFVIAMMKKVRRVGHFFSYFSWKDNWKAGCQEAMHDYLNRGHETI